MESPGRCGDWLTPPPSLPRAETPGRHDERGVGTSIWPPAGTSSWPPPRTFSRPRTYASCRCDGARKTIPGWPFSLAAGLEWGASSWTAPLETRRIGPDDDATVITVAQVGAVTRRLDAAGALA